ncbi:hypothetical protein LJR220_003590 [Bradyrhizobium sp. LjRoot220]
MFRAQYRELGRTQREVRGIRLLQAWLSAEQRVQFNKYGYFEVTGCHSGKRYRICYGSATNIHELDQYGRPKAGWCFVPNQPLVPGDVMLAQKIALETDEWSALAVAKSFRPTWH